MFGCVHLQFQREWQQWNAWKAHRHEISNTHSIVQYNRDRAILWKDSWMQYDKIQKITICAKNETLRETQRAHFACMIIWNLIGTSIIEYVELSWISIWPVHVMFDHLNAEMRNSPNLNWFLNYLRLCWFAILNELCVFCFFFSLFMAFYQWPLWIHSMNEVQGRQFGFWYVFVVSFVFCVLRIES